MLAWLANNERGRDASGIAAMWHQSCHRSNKDCDDSWSSSLLLVDDGAHQTCCPLSGTYDKAYTTALHVQRRRLASLSHDLSPRCPTDATRASTSLLVED